jgi:hypothetical protein
MAKGWDKLLSEARARQRRRQSTALPPERKGPDLSNQLRGVELESEEFEINEGKLTRKLHN